LPADVIDKRRPEPPVLGGPGGPGVTGGPGVLESWRRLPADVIDKWSFAMVAFLRGTAAYAPQTVNQIVAGIYPSKGYGAITQEIVLEIVNGDPGRFKWVEPAQDPALVQVSRPRRETRGTRHHHGHHRGRPSFVP
jgi:hypothetical protein